MKYFICLWMKLENRNQWSEKGTFIFTCSNSSCRGNQNPSTTPMAYNDRLIANHLFDDERARAMESKWQEGAGCINTGSSAKIQKGLMTTEMTQRRWPTLIVLNGFHLDQSIDYLISSVIFSVNATLSPPYPFLDGLQSRFTSFSRCPAEITQY